MVTNQSTKIVTGKVRLSYCHLFEPQAIEGGDPKYSVTILIPKSDETTVNKIKSAIALAAENGKAKFGGKVPANLKNTLRDGDEEKDVSEQPEYKNCYFMNVSSRNKPGVVDKDLNPILDSSEIYSGCYGRVSLNFYAYNTAGNKGVSAGLNNVMKLADGDYLGGRSSAEDDFKDIEDILG